MSQTEDFEWRGVRFSWSWHRAASKGNILLSNKIICGKMLVLNVDCPECGAAPSEPCKTANDWGFHEARYAVQKGSSRS